MNWALLLLFLFGACSPAPGLPRDGGTLADGARADGAAAPCPGTRALARLSGTPSFAVVLSDYSSTAIAMLDETGEVLDRNWIHSGTTAVGLVASLSGDVVLPSQQLDDGTMVIIDRFRTDVVSRFCTGDGTLVGQVRVQEVAAISGFSSNPQDALSGPGTSLWISRHGVNLHPDEPLLNRGNDLLEVDADTMRKTGRRIDFSPLDTVLDVSTPTGTVRTTGYARPSRGIWLDGIFVVGMTGLDASLRFAAPGQVAWVDPETLSVRSMPLPPLTNCGQVTPVPNAADKAVVNCTGWGQPYGDPAQTRASAGIRVLQLSSDGSDLSVVARWDAAVDSRGPIALQEVVALNDLEVVGISVGELSPPRGDTLYRFRLDTGAASVVHRSRGPFEIGTPAYDELSGLLLVPDASDGAVHRFWVRANETVAAGRLPLEPVLPPRAAYRLAGHMPSR